ncbi:MAG: amino acid ABC transporter permease [Rhodospirillaceae bacterium]|nr:amino acid ABC transporter permease [Rhodospirillaceae bacterium]
MSDFTTADIIEQLVLAARWTVVLSLIAFLGGGLAGLAVALMRIAERRWLRWAAMLFIEAIQGTPLLMLLFLCFFGMALIGIETTPWIAATVALTLYAAAFLGEIWRGCIQSVPRGQWDAADSLALGYLRKMRFVILPQALRVAVPPTVGFLVQVVKGTALASIIGFVDVTKAGQMIANATFEPFLVYGVVGLIYFALCYPISLVARRLERRLAQAH